MSSEFRLVGGCHCGFITYELLLTELPTKATRCNCSFCRKLGGSANLYLDNPTTEFKLLSPSQRSLCADYSPSNGTHHRYFCTTCGSHVFCQGQFQTGEGEDDVVNYFGVNLLTLEQPQEGIDISKVKIEYSDGLADAWHNGTRSEPWSGGMR